MMRLHRWTGDERDAGVTLTDLLVSMSILTVVLTMFLTAVIPVFRLTNGTESRSAAQSQISLALLKLDKQLRSTAAIEVYDSGQYALLLVTRPSAAECVQLRVVTGKLQQRTWTHEVTPVVASSWTTLASGITSTAPFTAVAPDDSVPFGRLNVHLVAVAGKAPSVTRESGITFTALNSDRDSDTHPCAEGKTLP